MNRVLRWLKPFSAAGIGFMLNLAVSVVAYAGVISPRSVDPQGVAVAGAAGGLVRRMMDAAVLACAFAAFESWGYAGPIPDGIAWLRGLSAITSTTMLVSMLVHGRLVDAEMRAADVGAVKEAVREVVPEAMDAANARLLDHITEEPVPGYQVQPKGD